MNNIFRRGYAGLVVMLSGLLLASALYADKNQVLGEVQLEGATKVEKTSGVWVDRQYVGYLKELKGSKKILLLPGEHLISVREDGYKEFTQQVQVEPGQTEVVRVLLQKAVTPAGSGRTVGGQARRQPIAGRSFCRWPLHWTRKGV